MDATKTREQTISWLKTALERQKIWQDEVQKRWIDNKHSNVVAAL